MSDRPPIPPHLRRVGSDPVEPEAPTGAYASAEDAVFEDIQLPGDGQRSSAPPTWSTLAPDPAPPSPAPVPARDVTLGYDPQDGFRIDFEEAAEPSMALAPLAPAVPAPPRPALPAPPPAAPPLPPPVPPRAEARRSFVDKARMLRRYRWSIVALTLLGLAAGIAYALLTPPTYKAHSLLLIDAAGASDRPGGVAVAPGQDESKVFNQALVLQQAPEIAERTAAALLERPDVGAFTTVQAAGERFGTPVTADALADHLQDKVVTVEPASDRADAIKVEATAGRPEEAALVASLYTDEYQALTRSTSSDRSTRTREILDEQIMRREGELDEIERQLERFMTAENAAGLDEQTRVTVSSIGQLQASLDLARVEAQTQRARLGQLRADLASVPQRLERSASGPSIAETADLDAEITRVERLLEQIYRQNPELRGDPTQHPDVANLDLRLRNLRAERRARVGAQTDNAVAAGGLDLSSSGANGQSYVADLQRQISQVQAELAGAEARAATLQSRLGEARGQLRAVPGQQVELGQLQRRQATTAATLQQLQAEFDQAQLSETTELGFAQVIREVQVPREPAGPALPTSAALGGLLGLLLGLGLAVLRHQTDGTTRTPDDLRDHGFAVIGTVPDITEALRGGRQDIDGGDIHPALVTLTRSFAPEAEAFRHLHAGLYSGTTAPQVVVVASPDRHVGKSLVAANLAAAAAQAGRRVLLVDADLRQPTVGALFGLGEHPPLGEGPEGTNLVYWSTTVPGLFAMTPRDVAESPDQMWAPHQVGALLHNLRAAFDLVIIDTPAALASADATLLAPHADAALLVAEADQTSLDALAQVATELASVGLSRIGTVLNRFDARSAVGYRTTAGVRHAAPR